MIATLWLAAALQVKNGLGWTVRRCGEIGYRLKVKLPQLIIWLVGSFLGLLNRCFPVAVAVGTVGSMVGCCGALVGCCSSCSRLHADHCQDSVKAVANTMIATFVA